MEGNKCRVLCSGTEQISLRNHQRETLDILKELDEKRESFSTIVNLPTGGGKTRIGIDFCLGVLEKGAKVLWIADRIPLLEQTADAFGRFKSEREYKCQFIWAKDKGKKLSELLPGTDVVFASVQTIAKVAKNKEEKFIDWLKESQKEDRKLYIVYDEAHHIGASNVEDFFASLIYEGSYDEDITEYYHVKRFGIIGLTATVYRGDKYLDAFNKWFKDGYDKETGELRHITSGYGECDIGIYEEYSWNRIAIVDIQNLIAGYNGDAPVLVEPEIIKISEYDEGMPGKEGKRDAGAEMKYLADRITGNYGKWGETAVIVDSIEKAKILKNLLDEKGCPNTFTITSGSEKTEDNQLDAFKGCKDDNKILIGVRMLDEGIDIPKLETLYLYAPTMSQVVLRQRIGRVLRNPGAENGKIKKARVIWQHYPNPNKRKYIDGKEFEELLSKEGFNEEAETKEEMEQDKKDWREGRSYGIPPAMYKEPLSEDRLSKKDFYSEWHRLEIEKLFSSEEIAESECIGFFYDKETFDSTDCVIYVRDVERKGYRQLLRVLQNDWQSVLRYHDCKNFEEYADALGVEKEEDLLDYIKQICFYLSDSRKIDTSGHKLRKRILVRDGDIKTFCGWFLRGEIGYKRLQGIYKDRDDTGQKESKEPTIGERERSFMYSQAQKEKDKVKEMIKDSSCGLPSWEGKKEYTDLLEYCGKYIYQDVMSVKSLLRMGVCDKKHRILSPEGEGKVEWAFVGKNEVGEREEVKHIPRRTKKKFDRDDWLLIASALVEMPDHIWVMQEDVDEYEKKLLDKLSTEIEAANKKNEGKEQLDKEQLDKEFLMALGYCKNDDIIRRQCEIFGEDLPKIIQYILYEKAYEELCAKVSFKGGDGKIHAECKNGGELEEAYVQFLKKYNVKDDSMKDMSSPVEDVIYDYRPYLKAVPYYQGIKPEFLCRMANSIVQGRKNAAATTYVIDAFGGSGACTMNGFYKKMKPSRKQVYNDLGIMNTAFYRCLQDKEMFKSLKKEVDKIIEKAFSDYNENGKMGRFFSHFDKYLDYREKAANTSEKEKIVNVKKMLEKTIKECEEDYVKDFDTKVSKYRNGKVGGELESYNAVWLEDRLGAIHENYAKKLDIVKAGIGNYKAVFRSIERYMHVFMLKVNALYLVLVEEVDIDVVKKRKIKDTDLAVLFLMYNSLTHRHFYNHCTIENIGKFRNSYQACLEYGREAFRDVGIKQENAIELLGDSEYNQESTVWYLDIPYAETSSADYVPDWFDTEKFLESLSGCKGTYIVSSRCNICLPEEVRRQYSSYCLKKKPSNEENTEEISNSINKEWNVFSFFNSFVNKSYAVNYEKFLTEAEKEGCMKKWVHLPKDKKAKYILIPYTKMQEDYFVEDDADKAQAYSLEKNNSKATAKYVRRMLAATHNSNIPVEVMITNAKLDFESMHAQKTEEGIYVMPTFKMGTDGSQYMVEPLVIIMEYEKFMEQMLRLLYHEVWEKLKNRKIYKAFQKLYEYQKKTL